MSVLLGKSARKKQQPIRQPKYNLPPSLHEKTARREEQPIRLPKCNLPPSSREKTARREQQKIAKKPQGNLQKNQSKSHIIKYEANNVSSSTTTTTTVPLFQLELKRLPEVLESVKRQGQNAMEIEVLQMQMELLALKKQEHLSNLSNYAKYWIQLDPTTYTEEMRALGEEERLRSMNLWPCETEPREHIVTMSSHDISTLLGNLQFLQKQRPEISQSELISL